MTDQNNDMSQPQLWSEDINMYDPKREYVAHKQEFDEAIANVINHGLFINGPEVKELETQLADFVNIKHCIGVSSGTDALLVALMAIGVQPGDEVPTVAHTWISTAEVISLLGATPVFVDIEATTYNIDIDDLFRKITSKTKAIIPVSLYGQMPDYSRINQVAEQLSQLYGTDITVIEDGAQSFGAASKDGESCGVTKIGCTSFFPSKPLGCWGDGGAVFTNDDQLALKMKAIRNHGCLKRFEHSLIGLNARLDSLQAAILLAKFKHFQELISGRDGVAKYYNVSFAEQCHDLIEEGKLVLPKTLPSNRHVWAQYSLLLKDKETRDKMVDLLKEQLIRVAIFYPAPLHLQECFAELGYKRGDLPVTEEIADRIINLPCYGQLRTDELKYIIKTFVRLLYQLST